MKRNPNLVRKPKKATRHFLLELFARRVGIPENITHFTLDFPFEGIAKVEWETPGLNHSRFLEWDDLDALFKQPTEEEEGHA